MAAIRILEAMMHPPPHVMDDGVLLEQLRGATNK